MALLRSPAAAGLFILLLAFGAAAQDAKRGEYVSKAAGCLGCHTEEKKDATPYAGGRALKTPFGTFFGPNITPHREAGIGAWSEADFLRAMREGRRPDGANLFPAFPYPSFTRMNDADLKDLWAYLRSLPANATPSKPHELGFFYRWRFLVSIWKWFFFTPGPMVADAAKSAVLNRGAYLVQAMGHCGECHTPRNFLGGPKESRFLGGAKLGETAVPNITPTRLKKVSDAELKELLRTATTSDGDVLAESMSEVVRNTTSQLTEQDLDAMLAYLRSLPALPDEGK
ncbi:MAG TPA: cytochrome c [Burkholderiales bacterium]|nr:cytochrome c [Burkholderiales bacterium]